MRYNSMSLCVIRSEHSLFPDKLYLRHDIRNGLYGKLGQRRSRSDSAFTRSNQDLHCPCTESMDTENISVNRECPGHIYVEEVTNYAERKEKDKSYRLGCSYPYILISGKPSKLDFCTFRLNYSVSIDTKVSARVSLHNYYNNFLHVLLVLKQVWHFSQLLT